MEIANGPTAPGFATWGWGFWLVKFHSVEMVHGFILFPYPQPLGKSLKLNNEQNRFLRKSWGTGVREEY